MAYKLWLTTKNSAWKIYQNPLKGNTYTDIVGFKNDDERDKFLNKYLEVSDWKAELDKKEEFKKSIKWEDEIHFTFDIDLTRDTMFGLDKNAAMRCDFLIMEDTNQSPDQPHKRYTFWSIESSMNPNQVYTSLRFHAEKDVPFTYGIDYMFKDNVKMRLDRCHTNSKMGYGSELSWNEGFQLDDGDFVSTKHGYLGTGDKSTYLLSFDCSEGITANEIYDTQPPGNILHDVFKFPLWYNKTDSNKVIKYAMNIQYDNASDYDLKPDIAYFLYQPSGSYLDNRIKGSEYLLGIQLLPFSIQEYIESNPSSKMISWYVTEEGKDGSTTSTGWNNPNAKDGVKGSMIAINDGLTENAEIDKLITDSFIPDKAKNIPLESLLLPNGIPNNAPNWMYSKMAHSEFNRIYVSWGNVKFQIKPELWHWNEEETLKSIVKYYYSPSSSTWLNSYNLQPYYGSLNQYDIRAIKFMDDTKIPYVKSGNQSVLQNNNTVNLTNDINRRNQKFQDAQGDLQEQRAVSTASSFKNIWSNLFNNGASFNQQESSYLQGELMRYSSFDNINLQAAQLADSMNNTGMYSDGTTSGILSREMYGVPQIICYELIPQLKQQIIDYLDMYGNNLGGDLYDIHKKIHTHKKYVYVKASDDLSSVYQSFNEELSPQESKIMALAISGGMRIWWSDEFTFIGDYGNNPVNLED